MIKILRTFYSLFLITIGLSISGCAKYTPHQLKSLNVQAKDKNGIKLAAVALTDDECRYHFSRRIISKGYKPIQLYIFNNSNHGYIFDAMNINMAIERRDSVAQTLHLNTPKRILPYAIPALFLGFFFIPAIVEGSKSYEANNQLDKDFSKRVIDSESRIFIAPGSVLNRTMFIRSEDFVSPLIVDLFNKDTNEKLTFIINI